MSRPTSRSIPSASARSTRLLILFALLVSSCHAAVTVYDVSGSTSTSGTSSAATGVYTGLPAYDPVMLIPPNAPSPPKTGMWLTIPPNADALVATGQELSVKQRGNFLGFSVELSVASDVIGDSAQNIKVPFLNYMANIRNRAGQGPIVRVGGNTQESSTFYSQGFLDGRVLEKTKTASSPIINYSPALFYAMRNVSDIVDVVWYFGLPFNQSAVENGVIPNIPQAAAAAQEILGDLLLGLQIGNEPDLYADHGTRPAGYNVTSYLDQFAEVKQAILTSDQLSNPDIFVGPGVCCNILGFELQDVFNAGFLTQNAANVPWIAVQHYPTNNCQLNGTDRNAQDIFVNFLNHTSSVELTLPYLAGTQTALAAGKEMIMFEFNTASCGGFPGLSDSFGASLWITDYALQMAYRNFTAALLHVGGQSTYYNPFTPPPSGSPSNYQWTTGSAYYPTLVVAEVFGSSNVSQIVDLSINDGSIYSPVYAVYENGAPTRAVLFNFVNDPSGASTYWATIDFAGSPLPQSTVQVRYLQAPTVSEKSNITWAGQSMGSTFSSDGRLSGTENTVTINCDTNAKTCTIPVYAPSIALVFLTTKAESESSPSQAATMTYGTTVVGKGSATYDPAALSTSNGQAGGGNGAGSMGSTSSGSVSSAGRSLANGDMLALTVTVGLGIICLIRWKMA